MRSHEGVFATLAMLLAVARFGSAECPQPMITPPPRLIPRQIIPGLPPGEVGHQTAPSRVLEAERDHRRAHQWKDPFITWIQVSTTTIAQPETTDLVLTATKGVSVLKNANGGFNILMSPGVKSKIELLAKNVPPCPAAARRLKYIKRQGPSSFVRPLTDQVWREDEGYESGSEVPGPEQGYEGEGFPEVGNSGPYHQDDEGFVEIEGEGTSEFIIFSTPEQAAEIQAELDAAIATGQGLTRVELLATAGTVTAGSFLSVIYLYLQDNANLLIPAITIPKENVHKLTRPKQDDGDKLTTVQSSSASCPTATEVPQCSAGCKATSTIINPQETNVVDWGSNKGCSCNPLEQINADPLLPYHLAFRHGLFPELSGPRPEAKCAPPLTPVASEFFGKIAGAFCANHFSRDKPSGAGLAFDIFGNLIPDRRRDLIPPISWSQQQLEQELRNATTTTDNSNHHITARAPPERPETYSKYRFGLHWHPKTGGKCRGVKEKDLCMSAFRQLQKSVCGTNSGGSTNDRLYKDASMDVGCGEMGWSITAQDDIPQRPEVGPQKCYRPYPHSDVVGKSVQVRARDICNRWKNDLKGKTLLNKDSAPLTGFSKAFVNTNERYSVTWAQGCDVVKEQELEFPATWGGGLTRGFLVPSLFTITGRTVSTLSVSMLTSESSDCLDIFLSITGNNKGGGGWRQVGCLRYEFHADSNRFTGDIM
ncbi:hypothetical protein QBC37DRAFT_375155 [Rhypophila decipiens]|uniref:Uncharacterized protein n=1 Tax=Rhypophila decipiens TaxID=261697 RepID=A0AAN7B6W5_9PEZI|nr:hypothetical protein QBC37DRAFT_375155 [Rhypophila decipiens]